jgi:hypothetical protein
MGHKGLFVERLDAPPVVWFFNDDERLAPEADLLVLMRNRQYLPRLGRFLQPDPNATGVAVQPSLAYGGSALPTPAPYVDLNSWAADGTSALAYALSDPVNGADPTGLFFSIGDVLGASSWQSDLQRDAMDEYSDVFESVRDQLQAYYDSVALDQMADFDWATNWDELDDFYIGSAEWSSGTGSWAALRQSPYRSGIDGSAQASASTSSGDHFGKGGSGRLVGAGVYVIREGNRGPIIYVGRSRDLARRMAEWKRWGKTHGVDLRPRIVYSNLTYGEMRGLEDKLIVRHNTLVDPETKLPRRGSGVLANKVRGVGANNPFAGSYTDEASEVLRGARKRARRW